MHASLSLVSNHPSLCRRVRGGTEAQEMAIATQRHTTTRGPSSIPLRSDELEGRREDLRRKKHRTDNGGAADVSQQVAQPFDVEF